MRSFLFFLNLEVSSPVAASLCDGAQFGLWMGNLSQKCFASYISVASNGSETFLHLCPRHFLWESGDWACQPSPNLWPICELQTYDVSAAVRASPSVNVSHKSLLLPGWALGRIYSCSLSSALPTIITLELEHKHLATLATCKENVPFVYLSQKHTELLIFELQSISSSKIELSQQNET